MHAFAQFLSALVAPLVAASAALTPWISQIAKHAPSHGDFALAALAVSAGAIAVCSGLWAIGERMYFAHGRQSLRAAAARDRAALVFRDALIAAGSDAVIALGDGRGEPLAFGLGDALLRECLCGMDAAALAKAVDALVADGARFAISARTPAGLRVDFRGQSAGGRAAIFARSTEDRDSNIDYRALLNALPLPIWLRDKNLNLKWGNKAFLATAGAETLDSAIASNVAVERSERDLALSVSEGNEAVDVKRYALIGGERRALAFNLRLMDDDTLAGVAVDLTDTTNDQARLRMEIDAQRDVLDRLATAIAIFGDDKKLAVYNSAYARLWGFSGSWLDSHPSKDEILDSLRASRRLPEQREFAAWKQRQLDLFASPDTRTEELWHLPNNHSVRMIAEPYALGGLIFIYEDVSDELRLKSSYNSLVKVQKATLDTIDEGIAVFGPDGRLKLHNAAFTRLWRFDEIELSNEPHLKTMAQICAARIGHDESWDIVSSGVNATEPEKYNEWGTVARMDGKTVSLSLTRLPDGATMVTFGDVTDYLRFEEMLRDGARTAA